MTDSHKEKLRNANKNNITINDGIINKVIKNTTKYPMDGLKEE